MATATLAYIIVASCIQLYMVKNHCDRSYVLSTAKSSLSIGLSLSLAVAIMVLWSSATPGSVPSLLLAGIVLVVQAMEIYAALSMRNKMVRCTKSRAFVDFSMIVGVVTIACGIATN